MAIVDVLRRESASTEPFVLEVARYRETRSVGMLVLADPSGRAAALAGRVQGGLESLGVYERERRPWLPHITVVRFRERAQLDHCPRSNLSLRPERLLCFHACTEPGRGTRHWSHAR